jgi:hypothetical protein
MRLRNFVRKWMAYSFPLSFTKWVNANRCFIQIENNPDGTWLVQIGTLPQQEHRSLHCAMLAAYLRAEADPQFKWCSDYLRE